MSSVHHKYSLLISIYVKRSLCQIELNYFQLLSNRMDFEDKSLIAFYLEEFLSFSPHVLKENYFFIYTMNHCLKQDNIS